MKKYTFKVDVNNASSYDRLIKIPTAYYRLASNGEGNGYTLHSHNNHSISINDRNALKLMWNGFNNKMVLYNGDSALKIDGNDFTIGQEDFIDSTHTQEIVTKFKSDLGTEKLASIYNIPNYRDDGIQIPVNDDVSVVLNFINFYNENDPVLQSITNKTNGLYFTIEDSSQNYSRSAYISYQDGRILRDYKNSPYRFSLYPYYYRLHDLEIKEELEKKIKDLEEKLENVKKMPGPKGEPGLKGDKGELGLPGNKGQDGPKGASGERGEKGNLGNTGPQGPIGHPGVQGPQGFNGTRGDPGPRGDTGVRGEKGEPGNRGDTGLRGQDGSKGASGEKGDKGSTGEVGPQGPIGYTGAQGPQGFNGTQGISGPRGDVGLRGEKGESGNRGDVGIRGEVGLKGTPGEKGPKGEDGIGAEVANQFMNTMNQTNLEISNIQKAVEANKNAAENAAKKVQNSESKVTQLHKQIDVLAKRADLSKNEAARSQSITETFKSQVKEMFCKTKPEDLFCSVHRRKREIKNFYSQPVTSGANRPTSFISQVITFFSPFIGEKIENIIQELNQTAKIIDTVDVVKKFEKVLGETALTCGISRKSLRFNPIELHSAIVDKSFNDDELLKFLCSVAKESCLKCKQIDKFLATFKDSMQRTLANNEQQQRNFFNIEKNEQPRSLMTDITSLKNIGEIGQAVAGYLR